MKKVLLLLTLASTAVYGQRNKGCPSVYADAYMDCSTGIIQLNASSGFDTYSWSPAGSVSNPNIANPTTTTTGTYTVTANTLGSELVTNGDFSAGNTGFTATQTYSSVYSPCNYFVGPGWFSSTLNTAFPDHTSTSDNMFMSEDGCTTSDILWEETMSVSSFNNYAFSFFASEADQVQPNFEIHFIGNSTGDVIVGTQMGIPYSTSTGWMWDQYGIPSWNSGSNTSVTIRIVNLETNGYGNDFGMDDFSFRKIICSSSYTVYASSLGMNLFTNGDFSAGNTGFTSGMTYSSVYTPCDYFVGPGWFSSTLNTAYPDHTGTSDNMFMSVDGCSPATVLWEETVPVTPGTIYHFEFWGTEADYIQPIYEIHFIGDVTGDNIISTQNGIPYNPSTGWAWDPYGVSCWNSGHNTQVTVRIVNLETNPTGNDFGLDDFSFRQCCNPDECCSGIPNGRIHTHDKAGAPTELGIFPNPNNGSFRIELSSPVENAQVELINVLGEQVDAFTMSGTSLEYSPSGKLEAGAYLIRITCNGTQLIKKIMIE